MITTVKQARQILESNGYWLRGMVTTEKKYFTLKMDNSFGSELFGPLTNEGTKNKEQLIDWMNNNLHRFAI